MNKKTIVIGASENPERYAYKATVSLAKHGHTVIPVGLKDGAIEGIKIITQHTEIKNEDINTVTLYVGPKNQPAWYNYIFSLQPKRIVFNPGTENPELVKMAQDKGIETIEACTLVMLSVGNY